MDSSKIFFFVKSCLNLIEFQLLKNKSFILGEDPSICDIYLFNEFMQLNVVGFDLSKRTRLNQFVKRVAASFPEYKTANIANLKIMKKRGISAYVDSLDHKL